MNILIKKWSDLENNKLEGTDSFTIIAKDPKTNKLRFIDVNVNTIAGPEHHLYGAFTTLYGDPNIKHERNS